jgi:SH3 domain protein
MKNILLILITSSVLFLHAPFIWAEKAYVSDSLRISLRRGPSDEHKILKFLPSGQPVEVLETEDEWSRVQLLEKDDTILSGWVLSNSLIFRLPWEDQAKALLKENELIKNELEKTRLDEKNLADNVKGYAEALRVSQQEYAVLKEESREYINLKASHEKIQRDLEKLKEENRSLTESQKNKWFATGALILLCGLMIGALVGRQEKKRRSYY